MNKFIHIYDGFCPDENNPEGLDIVNCPVCQRIYLGNLMIDTAPNWNKLEYYFYNSIGNQEWLKGD